MSHWHPASILSLILTFFFGGGLESQFVAQAGLELLNLLLLPSVLTGMSQAYLTFFKGLYKPWFLKNTLKTSFIILLFSSLMNEVFDTFYICRIIF
jgi:hypothetical protein